MWRLLPAVWSQAALQSQLAPPSPLARSTPLARPPAVASRRNICRPVRCCSATSAPTSGPPILRLLLSKPDLNTRAEKRIDTNPGLWPGFAYLRARSRAAQLERFRQQFVGAPACRMVVDHRCHHQLVGLGGGEERRELFAHARRRADEQPGAARLDALAVDRRIRIGRSLLGARERQILAARAAHPGELDGGASRSASGSLSAQTTAQPRIA